MNDNDSEDEGVGGEEVGDEDIPIVPILIDEDNTKTSDESLEHVPTEEDEPKEEDDTIVGSDNSGEGGEVGKNDEQQQEEVPPASVPRPRAVQELDSNLDGIH